MLTINHFWKKNSFSNICILIFFPLFLLSWICGFVVVKQKQIKRLLESYLLRHVFNPILSTCLRRGTIPAHQSLPQSRGCLVIQARPESSRDFWYCSQKKCSSFYWSCQAYGAIFAITWKESAWEWSQRRGKQNKAMERVLMSSFDLWFTLCLKPVNHPWQLKW